MERLTLEDAGSYECQVDTPWYEGFDPYFKVEVSVQLGMSLGSWGDFGPGHACPLPEFDTSNLRDTYKCHGSEDLDNHKQSPSCTVYQPGHRECHPWSSSQDLDHGQRPGLPVLLLLLSLLLLLLVGSLLLVWRRLQKRVKAGERSELSQNLRQAAGHSEPYYANLKLQTWSLQEEPVPPRQAEVEYSMLAFPREEPHYSSVVFDSPRPDSSASGAPSQRPPEEVPEYRVIRKPRAKEG
ncbi:CMRF35-like molecule 8 [Callospermophilus lateralis]|uniref:CMRF35-like molecule 8 n=1 Tax=Callospermophilus lateralis TaxID=76772 RepID=UPI0040540926